MKDFKENDLDVECENTCKNDGLCVSGTSLFWMFFDVFNLCILGKCFCQNPYIGPSCEFSIKNMQKFTNRFLLKRIEIGRQNKYSTFLSHWVNMCFHWDIFVFSL